MWYPRHVQSECTDRTTPACRQSMAPLFRPSAIDRLHWIWDPVGHSGGSSSLQTSRSPSLELIFSAYNLLVDMRHKHLSDTLTQLKVQGITAHTSSPSPFLLPPRPKTGFEAILCEFPAVIQPCNNNHSIKHEVDTPYHHYRSTSPFACQTVVPRAAQNCTAGI